MGKPKVPKQLSDLPKPYHTEVLAEISQQTDRGVALVGGAYIDLVLRDAITARLCDIPDIFKLLFENRGPLQSFGARIQIGFALGIYGRRAFQDFNLIKDIRNAFAHSAEAIAFNQTDISSLCQNLWFPKTIRFGTRPMPLTGKDMFIRAIELLTNGLYDDLRRIKAGFSSAPFLAMGPSLSPKSYSNTRAP